jgi:hypothetical protein
VRKETKAAIKAEREAAKSALKQTLNLTAADRVAEFMKEPIAPTPQPAQPVIRTEATRTTPEPQATVAAASASAAGLDSALPR